MRPLVLQPVVFGAHSLEGERLREPGLMVSAPSNRVFYNSSNGSYPEKHIFSRINLRVIAGALFLTAVLAGCGRGGGAEAAAPPRRIPLVSVAPAVSEAIGVRLDLTGETAAVNEVVLAATVEGRISYFPWQPGDRIEKAGQKLVEIERDVYRQEVKVAEANLAVATARLADLRAGSRPEEIAQVRETVRQLEDCSEFTRNDLDRVQALVKSGSLAGEAEEKARVNHVKCQTQLASARERLQMLEAGPTATALAVQESLAAEARARLELSRAKLAECVISAPFAGVVTKVNVRPGDLATPRLPLLTLMEPASLVVRFGVPEAQAARISVDTEVRVRLDAKPGRVYQGRVKRLYPQLEARTRTRLVEAEIVDADELLAGLFARIEFEIDRVENAVVVPDAAVLNRIAGGQVLFVLQDGKAQRRRIRTGIEQGSRVQVLEGVQAGEKVIVAGHQNLRDGSEVRLPKAPDAGKPGAGQPAAAKPEQDRTKGGQ